MVDKSVNVVVYLVHSIHKLLVGLVVAVNDTLVCVDTRLVAPGLAVFLEDYFGMRIVIDVLEPMPTDKVLALKKS